MANETTNDDPTIGDASASSPSPTGPESSPPPQILTPDSPVSAAPAASTISAASGTSAEVISTDLAAPPAFSPSDGPAVRLGTGVTATGTGTGAMETHAGMDYDAQTTQVSPDAITTSNEKLRVSRDAVVVSEDELAALDATRPYTPPSLNVAAPPPLPYGGSDTSLVDLGEAIADEQDDGTRRPPWWNIALFLLPILLAVGAFGIWNALNDDDTPTTEDQQVATDDSDLAPDATETESEISIGVDTDENGDDVTDQEIPQESEAEVSIGIDDREEEPEAQATPVESESEVSIGVEADEPPESIGGDESGASDNESGSSDDNFGFSESGGSTGGSDNSSGGIGSFSESEADVSVGPGDDTSPGGSGSGSGGGDGDPDTGSGNGGSGSGNGGGSGQEASVDFQATYSSIAPSTTDDVYTFETYEVPDSNLSFELPEQYSYRSADRADPEVLVDTAVDENDFYGSGIYLTAYGSEDADERIRADAQSITGDECESTETSEEDLEPPDLTGLYFADPISVGDWDGKYAYYFQCTGGGDPIDIVNIVFETDEGLVDIIARVENEQDLIAIDRLLSSIAL